MGKERINEEIIKETATAMKETGLIAAGYNYLIIDGGWRDSVLQEDSNLKYHPSKFPSGIQSLSNFIHSQNLKFGLHLAVGTHDCGLDQVGSWGNEDTHFQQILNWNVDLLKLDKCKFNVREHPDKENKNAFQWNEGWKMNDNLQKAYKKWHKLTKSTKNKIVVIASAYKFHEWYPQYANYGRISYDLYSKIHGGAKFEGTHSVMKHAEMNNKYASYAGNGYWNDPDMLVVGNHGLTFEQQKSHFALWCIMSSPLILGNDPRNMSEEELKLITNPYAIKVNQDTEEQGKRIWAADSSEIWRKEMVGGQALLLLNRSNVKSSTFILDLKEFGITREDEIVDIWERSRLAFYDKINVEVSKSASVFLYVRKKN